MRKFNVTGLCVPSKHYMVDIGGKLDKIIRLVEDGDYFTINRARQFGKTTTLDQLFERLSGEYICVNISFEGLDDGQFESSSAFCSMFLQNVHDELALSSLPESYTNEWLSNEVNDFFTLGKIVPAEICRALQGNIYGA